VAINTGDLLMGLGAAIGGTGPQFIQGLDQRDRQRTEQKRAELQGRQQAMYQDAATGLQLVRAGDLDGLIALGEDRLQLLQTYPDADPSDTQRIIQLARFAKQNDPVALRNLAMELTAATSRGLSMGLIKMPEAQKPMIVGADETVFDPVTGEALYTGPGKPADRKTAEDQNGVLRFIDNGEPVYPNVQQTTTSEEQAPLTDIGKLNRALQTGEITQAQFDAATQPKPVESKTYQESGELRREFSAIPLVRDFSQQASAFGRIQESARDPSAAGDMSLLFGYMKLLDPQSTVREGEQAQAQQATGIPGRVLNAYNAAVSGIRLNDEQRADFLDRSNRLYKSAESGFMSIYNQYSDLAKRRKLPIEDSLIDYRIGSKSIGQAPQDWISSGLNQIDWDALPEADKKAYLEAN